MADGWQARKGFREARELEISQQLHAAVGVLHHRRAVLHPVAAVIVSDSAERPDRWRMNVTAKDTLHVKAFRIAGDAMLISANKADGILDPPLCRLT